MKGINRFLFFGLMISAPMATWAQSTGGGGGGDRPTMVAWNQGPVQVNPSRATCRQLQETLQVFGKLRVNGLSPSGKPIFNLTSTRFLVKCTDPRQVDSFHVQTADKSSCSLGYICKDIAVGR